MSEAIVFGILSCVITPLVAFGVSWGVTKGRINGLADSVKELKANKYITREEYEARHTELIAQLYRLKEL